MKKLLSILLILLLAALMLPVSAAGDITVTVNVTDQGTLEVTDNGTVLTAVPVTVSRNSTVDDVLKAFHREYFSGGESGYASATMNTYGMETSYISKWFGKTIEFTDGSVSVAAWRNHSMSSTLSTTVRDGDVVDVCVYTLVSSSSYTYSYYGLSWLDYHEVDAGVGESFTLTAWRSSMDMMTYAYITEACGGMAVTINGASSRYRTNSDGTLTLSFEEPGTYYVAVGGDPAYGTASLKVNVASGNTFRGYTIAPPGRLAASGLDGETGGAQITAYVTVTELDGYGLDDNGERLVSIPVTVSEGATLDDVLDALHASRCSSGQEGYASASMEMYGAETFYISRWFGRNVDGSSGAATLAAAWVGHDMTSTLATSVLDGDSVNVVLYSLGEMSGFSYTYNYYGLSYFDHAAAEAGLNETVTLHAYTEAAAGMYGGEYHTSPLGDLAVYVNGEATDYKVDTSGTLEISFKEAGEYDILAVGSSDYAPAAMHLSVKEGAVFDASSASVSVDDVLAGNLSASGHGTGADITVYVTVTDKGEAVKSQVTGEYLISVPVTVPGGSTMDDALQALHSLHSASGAIGYSSYKMDMWGTTMYSIGSWFGKPVDTMDGSDYALVAWCGRDTTSTLATRLKDGDLIDVNIYGVNSSMSMDYRNWGLGYFDYGRVSADIGEEITLHAFHSSMDASTYVWNTYSSANLEVLVNGERSAYKVNEKGELKLSFEEPGEYLVLAKPGDSSYGAAAVRITVSEGASFADSKPDTAVSNAKQTVTKADYSGIWKVIIVVIAAAIIVFSIIKAVKKGKTEDEEK